MSIHEMPILPTPSAKEIAANPFAVKGIDPTQLGRLVATIAGEQIHELSDDGLIAKGEGVEGGALKQPELDTERTLALLYLGETAFLSAQTWLDISEPRSTNYPSGNRTPNPDFLHAGEVERTAAAAGAGRLTQNQRDKFVDSQTAAEIRPLPIDFSQYQ